MKPVMANNSTHFSTDSLHMVLVKFTANKSIKDCDRKLGDIKKHI